MQETENGPDEILYLSDLTRVARRRTPTGSVIVKQDVGGDSRKRLRNELRVLKRLKGIDGVPSLAPQMLARAPHELVLADTGSISLADALTASRMPIPRVMTLAIRLAKIVSDVHRAGIIHLDINPANILLDTTTGAPILIDFDLAATFNEKQMRFQVQSGIHGTLDYLAPEQTGRMNRTADERTDLYSLGVTLYEVSTGLLPFGGQDPLEVVHDHLALVSTSPHVLDPGVPEGLSEIIMHLIEKDPDRRYQSAEGLLHDLKMLDEALSQGETRLALLGERDFPAHFIPPTQLIGRECELARLRLALEDSHCTQGCFGMITGDPGVGKTMLTNELRRMTAEKSGWFIETQANEHRYDTGPGLVARALGMLGGLLLSEPETRLLTATQRMRKGLGNNIGVITAMVPEFALLLGDEHETTEDRSTEAEKRAGVAVVSLLRAVTPLRHPLVMVLGDLQWINESSLNVMSAIIQGGVPGLMVVGTYRETDVGPTHPLAHAMARWEQLGLAPEMLRLDNFGREDLAALLGSMLRLPVEDVESLAAAMSTHTGGNPFDTVELLNALRADKILELGADGWTWDNKEVRRFVSKTEVVALLAA
ncbi:MAG: AAA family ATPase [Coriobacteriia bacterium]|nr:AAA family ATPase [Coriobacteriia bacterium]